MIPDVAGYTIAARIFVAVLSVLVLEVQFRTGVDRYWLDLTCASAVVFGHLAWLVPSITTGYVDNLSYYIAYGALFLIGANVFFTFGIVLSIVSSFIILTSLVIVSQIVSHSISYGVAMPVYFFSCYVFASYINWRLNRERYNAFLKSVEAKRRASELRRALLRLSKTDSLTGLGNRRAVDGMLRKYWNDWLVSKRRFSIILINIDFFRSFNDACGSQQGDQFLRFIADTLRELMSPYEATIGRYSGDEFIVIIPKQECERISALAEELRRRVEDLGMQYRNQSGQLSVVTVSVGASYSRAGSDERLERIIDEAGHALHMAKAGGGNSVRIFDPENRENIDFSKGIASLLRVAVGRDLVSLVYQPVKNIASGRIEAFEALMRLTAPDGTSVPPYVFIPIAERTGAILELGYWVIRRACEKIVTGEPDSLTISINVSPVQLMAPEFVNSVTAILREMEVPGNRLVFELTERLEMESEEDVAACINDLKLLGIRFWLDDFGTGFSGLSWLRFIEFDTVKIDKIFLRDCETREGREMFRDIVQLVKNRGTSTLVEGVETERQMAIVREFEIDYAQGFYIGAPKAFIHLET